MNFLKFIELCFQTVMPGCEYNNYHYIKIIADRLEAAGTGTVKRIIFNMPSALNEVYVRECCMARMDTR